MYTKNTFKIVMLGEGRVGKTSLTLRYCHDKFNENEVSTINASCLEKDIEVDGRTDTMAIWDTAGQEMFTCMAPIYYRKAEGALVVYDITIKETFYKLDKWIKELRQYAGEDITIVIVGNKSDKENIRQVNLKEAQDYAKSQNVLHFSTSAKSGKGIHEAFEHLISETYRRKGAGNRPSRIQVRDNKKPSNQKGCC